MVTRVVVCLAVLTVGCGDDVGMVPPPQPGEVPGERGYITDQSGAVFGWLCDEERCKVENIDEPIPYCDPSSSRAIYSYTWGTFIEITPGCTFGSKGEWGSLPGWSRIVVCDADEDCPVVRNNGDESLYVCNGGFCKAAELTQWFDDLPNRWMMESICLGDGPRDLEHYENPYEVALEAACPGESFNAPCTEIPAGCRDPRG